MFEQKYPNIKVNLVNAGQPADEYPKLRTALKDYRSLWQRLDGFGHRA